MNEDVKLRPGETDGKLTVEKVCATLKTVTDPEIGYDIGTLGLIYGVDVSEPEGRVSVRMTLTTPRCPLSGFIVEQARKAVAAGSGVREPSIRLVSAPPGTPA